METVPHGEDGDKEEVLDNDEGNQESSDVYIFGRKSDDRATSFFAQPGILAGKRKACVLNMYIHVLKLFACLC